jgi:hypothetical protein
MTPEAYRPTGPELMAALQEATDWSNWFWDARDYRMAEQWHLVAESIQRELDALTAPTV